MVASTAITSICRTSPTLPLLRFAAGRVATPVVANGSGAALAAIELFQNVRTPATLVATALVPMGFGFPLVASLGNVDEDGFGREQRKLRVVKRFIAVIGFLSLASELLALCISTNAINRLSQDSFILGADEQSANTAIEILSKRPYSSFWVGTYTHFVLGILGLLLIAALRATVTVGMPYSRPVALLSGAVGLRVLATINRGLAVRDFGAGNFFLLCLNVVRLTFQNACRQTSISEIMSFVLILWAARSALHLGMKDVLAMCHDEAPVSIEPPEPAPSANHSAAL